MLIKSRKEIFDVDLCNNFFKHSLGLMFRFPKNDGLLFEFNKEKFISLHMLFVFLNIDIVYLDKNKKIVKILKDVKPFTPFIRPVKCKYILELKSCKNLKLNNKLKF